MAASVIFGSHSATMRALRPRAFRSPLTLFFRSSYHPEVGHFTVVDFCRVPRAKGTARLSFFGARPGTCSTGTGVWSRRLQTHAHTGLSAECASVDARAQAGRVQLAVRRASRGRTHLGDQAPTQHQVDRSTQEVRAHGITDLSAHMSTLRNACSVCTLCCQSFNMAKHAPRC